MNGYDRYDSAPQGEGPPPYILSRGFAGQKAGYVFKSGATGLGYYLDSKEIKKKTKNLVLPKVSKLGGTNGHEGISIEQRLAQSGVLKAKDERLAAEPLDTIHKPIVVPTSDPGIIPFVKSEIWRGAKAGYIFSTRDAGLGYHLDNTTAAKAAQQATSTAIVLSGSSAEDSKVKSLKFQLALFGDAKKKPQEIIYPFDPAEAAVAVERLSAPGHKFMNLNPLHVLDLHVQHTTEDLQMAFAKFCSLLNPKDNTDARAIALLETVEKAFEVMCTPEKRDRVNEVCVQARDRVEHDLKAKNKVRIKAGDLLIPLAGPEVEQLVAKMRYKLLAELDERFKRVELTQQRNKVEIAIKKEKLQQKKAKDEVWENEREDRVGGWRMFTKRSAKRPKLGSGTKLWNKTEERMSHQVGDAVEDEYTANNKYKRTWR